MNWIGWLIFGSLIGYTVRALKDWRAFVKQHIIDDCPPELDELF